MLKYLNLAVLLPSAKCYPNFIGSTWEIVWGLVTRWFHTHSIMHEIQKERKVVFFPALTLWKASGLFLAMRFLPFAVSGIFSQAGVLAVVCAFLFRSRSAPNSTSHFLPQGCFPVTIISCSRVVFRWEICQQNRTEGQGLLHPALTDDALWVPWEVTLV